MKAVRAAPCDLSFKVSRSYSRSFAQATRLLKSTMESELQAVDRHDGRLANVSSSKDAFVGQTLLNTLERPGLPLQHGARQPSKSAANTNKVTLMPSAADLDITMQAEPEKERTKTRVKSRRRRKNRTQQQQQPPQRDGTDQVEDQRCLAEPERSLVPNARYSLRSSRQELPIRNVGLHSDTAISSSLQDLSMNSHGASSLLDSTTEASVQMAELRVKIAGKRRGWKKAERKLALMESGRPNPQANEFEPDSATQHAKSVDRVDGPHSLLQSRNANGAYEGLGHGLWPLPRGFGSRAKPLDGSQFAAPTQSTFRLGHETNSYSHRSTAAALSIAALPGNGPVAIRQYHGRPQPPASDSATCKPLATSMPGEPRQPPDAVPKKFANAKKAESKHSKKLVPNPSPSPSPAYLTQAHQPPVRCAAPRPLLIISDLNGTLICRRTRTVHARFQTRPGLEEFLGRLVGASRRAPTHTFMLWTSSRPQTVATIVPKLLAPDEQGRCAAVWGRDRLGLTKAQYDGKTPVFKRLETVWADAGIQATHPAASSGARWDQSNTLLVDDSLDKAAAQPFSLVHLPEFTRASTQWERSASVLEQVLGYLDEACMWSDVSGFARTTPFRVAGTLPTASAVRIAESSIASAV